MKGSSSAFAVIFRAPPTLAASVRFRPKADIATRLSGGTEHQTGLLPKRVVATDETST